jgi:hypothetical protein
MVDLVVHHQGIKALKNAIKGPAAFVQAGHPQIVGPHGFGIEPGEAETTVQVSLLIASLYDLGVDQDDRRIGLFAFLVSATQTDRHHAPMHVDLWSSQSDPVRAVRQRVLEIVNQTLNAPAYSPDRPALLAQRRRVLRIEDNVPNGHTHLIPLSPRENKLQEPSDILPAWEKSPCLLHIPSMRVSKPFDQFVILKFHLHQDGTKIDQSSQDSQHTIPGKPKADRNADYTSAQWMPKIGVNLFIYQRSSFRENEIDAKRMTD